MRLQTYRQHLKKLPLAALTSIVLTASLLIGTGIGFGARAAHRTLANTHSCSTIHNDLWTTYRTNPTALDRKTALTETYQLHNIRAAKYVTPTLRQTTTNILSLDAIYIRSTENPKDYPGTTPLPPKTYTHYTHLLATNRTTLKNLCHK